MQTPANVVPDSSAAFVRAVQQVPRSARWLLPVTALLRRGSSSSTIERRVRGLVTLRMAAIDSSGYWLDQQRPVAADIGIADDEVAAVVEGTWPQLTSLSARERAALRWCEGVAVNEAKRDNPAYRELSEQFAHGEIVELTALMGLCALLDRFANALNLPRDPRLAVDRPGGVTPADLERWRDRMFADAAEGTH